MESERRASTEGLRASGGLEEELHSSEQLSRSGKRTLGFSPEPIESR